MKIYNETEDGIKVSIDALDKWVSIDCSSIRGTDTITLTRDEAIAAARAILAHYKEPV